MRSSEQIVKKLRNAETIFGATRVSGTTDQTDSHKACDGAKIGVKELVKLRRQGWMVLWTYETEGCDRELGAIPHYC